MKFINTSQYLRREILLKQLRRYVSVGRVIAEVRLQAECHQQQYVLVAVFCGAAPVRNIFAQLKVIVLPSNVIAAKQKRLINHSNTITIRYVYTRAGSMIIINYMHFFYYYSDLYAFILTISNFGNNKFTLAAWNKGEHPVCATHQQVNWARLEYYNYLGQRLFSRLLCLFGGKMREDINYLVGFNGFKLFDEMT